MISRHGIWIYTVNAWIRYRIKYAWPLEFRSCLLCNALANCVLIDISVISNLNVCNNCPRDLSDDKSILVQLMTCCHPPTNHYLSQSWPKSMSSFCVPTGQCFNVENAKGIDKSYQEERLWLWIAGKGRLGWYAKYPATVQYAGMQLQCNVYTKHPLQAI